jgi:fermentation-respiration switch protein FrsA (DUF1100 family)
MTTFRHLLGLVVLGYLLALLALLLIFDKVLFQPHPAGYAKSDGIVFIPVGEGDRIAAVWLPNPQARYTILHSHGNGEDLGDILPELREFHDQGYAVLGYDYRGYGLSSGRPSEANACADIEAAYRFLTENRKVPADRIIVHGYSVGGGPSVWLASRYPVAGLVLESCFTTALSTVTRVPLFPVDRFRNIDLIAGVTAPILVIHGTADRVVPYSLGEKLYRAAPSPKRFFRVEGAGHYDLRDEAGERYWREYGSFIPPDARPLEVRRNDPALRTGPGGR